MKIAKKSFKISKIPQAPMQQSAPQKVYNPLRAKLAKGLTKATPFGV